ncbi:putative bifunctional diguanylate cyclase/phosphodiesterase [Pseudomonas sp. KNUC1026]|uniref:putative bifunctional diguanylate cyclase/phosphodiesterase n=1 Tax=Pseudomonas sp. KNUC1026 TaxID=2893890 RepID=UPI001F254527|nr:EAL domain-containing protein [Pseudomonas sp. KNUC1026]UFH48196.1 EAL domain-containing protein [Pseudomonas sp. KNUC1026]
MKPQSSFQARITALLVLLLLAVIALITLAVKVTTADAVRAQATDQLEVGTRVFERLLDFNGRRLRDAVQLLAADFGFRDAVASDDSATVRSALANHGSRIGATDVFLLGMDGTVMASTVDSVPSGQGFLYDQALREARRRSQSSLIVPINGQPHLLVEAQVMAPLPVARVVMGFTMDADFARELHALSSLQVSIMTLDKGQPGPLVSTQPPEFRDAIGQWLLAHPDGRRVLLSEVQGQRFLNQSLVLAEDPATGGKVVALLQSPLDDAFRAFAPLDHNLMLIASAALVVSLLASLLLGRSLTRPVRTLAAAAERIGRGDYQTPVHLSRDDELGSLAGAINLMQEGIAEREQRLAHNALHDHVTGLPNRALATERLGSAIAAERPMALLYISIDNLRGLAENGGPAYTELLLGDVSRTLEKLLSPGDTLAYLIGGEFLLLLDQFDSDRAVAVADQAQQWMIKPRRVAQHDVSFDTRIGIAAYPADGDDAEALLSRAAIAMQDAQDMPGRLQVYQQGRDLAHQRQIQLIRDLRRAAGNAELFLAYQPKLDIRDAQVRQAEALLRWQHPQFGLVSPGEFIPLAERTGSIQLLTCWVLEEGIRQLSEWRGRGLHVQLSLNISADDLGSDALAEQVPVLLREHGVPAEQLIFEITESAVMREPEAALKVLNRLREVGVSLSIDDFGTGYSSLAHLKRMPVQELKIDQSFVRNLDETSEDAVIVRSTIEMSHNLGLKVVAEGVEYEHSLRLLERWQCDTAQGYLISRPLTASAFEIWLRESLYFPTAAEPAL